MEAIRNAVQKGKLPGAVVLATTKDGKKTINEAIGVKNAQGEPRSVDTVCRLASCTKLLTAICVLQAAERGLLDLDAPVKAALPEIADLAILTGYNDDGTPITQAPQADITFTHLLTHSSGLGYAFSSPLLLRWLKENGRDTTMSATTFAERFTHPLLFEPGTQWLYGSGNDWAGRAFEAATQTTLDAWIQEHVAGPLGAQITFFPQRRPEVLSARGDIAARTPAGGIEFKPSVYWQRDAQDCFGGGGAFASPDSYFRVLRSLLLDDGKLLAPASRARLFAPALTPAAQESIMAMGVRLGKWSVHGLVPAAFRKSFALGGLVGLDDETGPKRGQNYRRAGNLSWSGMPNHFWVVDDKAGLAAFISFHMDPWADETCIELGREVEEEIYASFGGL